METIHDDGHPLTQYLEANGTLEPSDDEFPPPANSTQSQSQDHDHVNTSLPSSFAPLTTIGKVPRIRRPPKSSPRPATPSSTSLSRIHLAWSSAWNSRVGAADNAQFMEHFRYIIVASQLLNEYLDHGALQPSATQQSSLDGQRDVPAISAATTSLYGALAAAATAFALVYVIHWARTGRFSFASRSRVLLILTVLAVFLVAGYIFARKQWLKFLRRNAVNAVTDLTSNWQALEVSTSSALTFIQEVELVSKGYRISNPLPPASRIEEQGPARRCHHLRKCLHKVFINLIPACVSASAGIKASIDPDTLERFFDVYDISSQDAQDASGPDALLPLDDDAESLKSLRVLSYRLNVLRRVTLCTLMSLEADGSKTDFYRWRTATIEMDNINRVIAEGNEKLRKALNELETIASPISPVRATPNVPRDRLRAQVRKISMLSSGIKGLQAKMQILREETNHSISNSEDLNDLGPSLMAQYESIGADLKELMQAWETGKETLQNNITRQERRLSLASSGLRSTMSSIGGLTAVEEGTPDDALRALSGERQPSNRSSLATPSSDDEVFEAIAIPKQRSSLTREERIVKMQNEREKQVTLRARREANTSMLRELESVIHLRPKKTGDGPARVTSV